MHLLFDILVLNDRADKILILANASKPLRSIKEGLANNKLSKVYGI